MTILSVEERFWAKVDKRGPDECWPWTASLNGNGYGQFGCPVRKRPIPASRFAMELTQDVPEGMLVLHHCDNPPCCNPRHLYIGTAADNTRDMMERGRHKVPHRGGHVNVGAANGMAKLSNSAVRMIRHSDLSERRLAEFLGVSTRAVSLVREGKTWRHVV